MSYCKIIIMTKATTNRLIAESYNAILRTFAQNPIVFYNFATLKNKPNNV